MAPMELDTSAMDNLDSPTVQIPSTPPPGEATTADTQLRPPLDKSAFTSPPPPSSSMTPPPSTQVNRFPSPKARFEASQHDFLLASPPATIKLNAASNLPTTDALANASIDELRSIAQDLMSAVREARMAAAHFKLQHNLLTMETQESSQRAEVEHMMTRREVEVLQAAEQRHRSAASQHARASQTPSQSQIDTLAQSCKVFEEERDEAERRLRKAKKLLELEKDRSELLMEENLLLKKRIRENREHFTRMKSQSPAFTPRDAYTTPQRKAVPRFTDSTPSHAPFAALLAADQVLNGESLSVPSTPTKLPSSKAKAAHSRGAHSLSSLHTTPVRTRPATSDGYPTDPRVYQSAPGLQKMPESAERDQHDRDSTISISDDDENDMIDDVPASQASSLATSMLRKNPGSQESLRLSQSATQSSTLLQTKLLGKISKPSIQRAGRKRAASSADEHIKAKKAKLSEAVGLGIGAWSPTKA